MSHSPEILRSQHGEFVFSANVTNTVFTTQFTFVKVLGSTTATRPAVGFTHANNRLTLDAGQPSGWFDVSWEVNAWGSTAGDIIASILRKNGVTDISIPVWVDTTVVTSSRNSGTLTTRVFLDPTEYVELFAANWTSTTNRSLTYGNVYIRRSKNQ